MGKRKNRLLLFVGRIAPNKGLHVLLKSLQYLEKPVHLVIIGGPGMDRKYYLDILESIRKKNQQGKHHITYLGAMDQAELIEWYQKASLFVLPSFREGFSVSTIEALSCETPVVASAVGGLLEIVKDYENGILTPLNAPVPIAHAIQYLLDNKSVRTKLGREGRKQVINSYSLDASVEKLCRIYRQISS